MSLHHAIADGVTIGLFIQQLSECYGGNNIERIDALAQDSYFQIIQTYELLPRQWSERESQFWLRQFADTTDLADLPPNYSSRGSAERAAVHRRLDSAAYQQIRRQAARLNVSSFHFAYGVYLLMLAHYTGESQILSAFQSSGRRGKPEAQQTLGMFSNALGLKMQVCPDVSYREFVSQLRDRVYACLQYERYPYHELIKQTGVHPKFGMNWYPRYDGLRLPGVDSEQIEVLEWQSDFDLNLHCLTNADQLTLNLHYDPARFDAGRMSLFVEQLENALHQVSADPEMPVDAVRLTTSADRRLPNPTDSWPRQGTSGTIHERFFESVERHRDRPALSDDNGPITYAQLADRINDVADELQLRGVAPGARVAILARRSPAVVVAMIAALKSGGAFAVLDMEYPEERLRHSCEVLQPDFLLIIGDEGGSLPLAVGFAADCVVQLSTDGRICPRPDGLSPNCVTLHPKTDDGTAYYLFTSGTTGVPQCVRHAHHPLLHFVDWHVTTHGLDAHARFAMTSGLSHDPILRDIFTPLFIGACCYIPSECIMKRPESLWSWLGEREICVLHSTPQITKLILMGRRRNALLPKLTHLFWGGDILTAEHAQSFLSVAPQAKGVNFYGTTETPQAVSHYPVDATTDYAKCPIGVGIPGAQLLVLSADQRRRGYGEIGEIGVRTHHLSLGYTDSSLTDKKFVELDESIRAEPSTVYLTGDIGYYLPSGDVCFLGRRDHQVKIRGNRVELGEVTRVMESLAGIRRAAVTPIAKPDGEQALVAYYVTDRSQVAASDTMDNHLRAHLPAYMKPSLYIEVDSIPLTPNGKLDFAHLPPPDWTQVAHSDSYVMPETELERRLTEEYEQVLGMKSISVESTFSNLGGDSLSYIHASMVLEDLLGTLPEQWEQRTIRELAGTKPQKSLFPSVEMTVLMRAIAICAVVAGHFKLISFHGAVAALLVVAGHSFGRFQVNSIANTGRVGSILRLMTKIAIPTILYTLLVQTVFQEYYLPSILLLANFFHHPQGFDYWFVAVLVQNLAIFACLLSIRKVRQYVIEHPFVAALLVFATSYLLRLLGPFVWDTTPIYDRVPHMTICFMAYGWCVAVTENVRQKLLVALVAGSLILLEYGQYGSIPALLLVAIVAILIKQRVRVPLFMNRVITLIAAASLFIYLTHFQARSFAEKIGIVDPPLAQMLVALLIGVACYLAWEKGTGVFFSLVTRFKCRPRRNAER